MGLQSISVRTVSHWKRQPIYNRKINMHRRVMNAHFQSVLHDVELLWFIYMRACTVIQYILLYVALCVVVFIHV